MIGSFRAGPIDRCTISDQNITCGGVIDGPMGCETDQSIASDGIMTYLYNRVTDGLTTCSPGRATDGLL